MLVNSVGNTEVFGQEGEAVKEPVTLLALEPINIVDCLNVSLQTFDSTKGRGTFGTLERTLDAVIGQHVFGKVGVGGGWVAWFGQYREGVGPS